jgi:hypothetical protein
MLTKYLNSQLGRLDQHGTKLITRLTAAKDPIVRDYQNLNFAAVVRTIAALADQANRYVEQNQPWATVKVDLEKTRTTLTAVLNAVRILTIYLKPILPKYAEKIEKLLNVQPLSLAHLDNTLQNHKINDFERLVERIDKHKVHAMIEESKETQAGESVPTGPVEPIAPECSIDDFSKIDLRIARIENAQTVQGADKLLRLQLDVGGLKKTCLAAVARAYNPDQLSGQPKAQTDEVWTVRRYDSRHRHRRKRCFYALCRYWSQARTQSTLIAYLKLRATPEKLRNEGKTRKHCKAGWTIQPPRPEVRLGRPRLHRKKGRHQARTYQRAEPLRGTQKVGHGKMGPTGRLSSKYLGR